MPKSILTAALLIFVAFNSSAQKKKKNDEQLLSERAEWFEGSIMLTDGSELKGLVKYNDRNGVLSYDDGKDSRVFTPQRVAGFEFFDESVQKQRVFYTFEYEDSETNVMRPLFFEVMKEYKTFAVLTKADRIDVDQKSINDSHGPTTYNPNTGHSSPLLPNSMSNLVVSQTETIYLMSSSGEIKPYFKEVQKEDGNKSLIFAGTDTKTKNKMIDGDLLEKFIPTVHYQKLKEYADKNNLKFKKKNEFLQIMDYYDSLVGK